MILWLLFGNKSRRREREEKREAEVLFLVFSFRGFLRW